MRRFHMVALAFAGALVWGCGPSYDGPPRFELTGTVTYDGEPLPGGYIFLEPDAKAGGDGPAGFAEIHDGKFRTKPAKGSVGGPQIARISGMKGGPSAPDSSNYLFEDYKVKVELPESDSQYDFVVPKIVTK